MSKLEYAIKLSCALAVSAALIPAVNALRTLQPEVIHADTAPAGGALSREDITYVHVDAPQAKENGVITAEAWSSVYPEIAATLAMNADNSYRISYLDDDQDPYLKNVYEGYGFAKDYTSAIGHTYCLEDVHNTQRPHPLANCLTCKTPDFTKLVNDLGDDAYSLDFEETWQNVSENTSCYNCHANEAGNAGQLVVTHSYTRERLADHLEEIDAAVLSCGQCHTEYYFRPENKATSVPYTSVETMTPEAGLAYYNDIGFTDWVQESTGTNMLKVQHPEMETFMQGKHAKLLNCADCHMAIETAENGTVYHSHKFESPLENQALLDTCAKCHGTTDMAVFVRGIQEEITAREKEVGTKLSGLKDALAAAVADGTLTEEELNEVRQLYRDAQWFWDYSYVENSEGAHNSELSRRCLDTSEGKITQAMELLGA